MALDFPGTPATGTTYTGPGGVIWVYDGAKWISGTLTTGIYAPITNDVGRNLIHNSMFNVWQRGTTFGGGFEYTADRWCVAQVGCTHNIQQFAVNDAVRASVGDEEFTYAMLFNFTGTAGAADFIQLQQRIENVRRLAGKTVIVSFWAACSAGTLKIGINMAQDFGTGGSPSAAVQLPTGQSFTLSTTYARFSATFTLPSIAGKTLGTNNNHMTLLQIFGSSGATSNAAAGNVGVQSGTINIWGVQLEIGPTATPLEKLDPVTQLQQCQRFYQIGQFVSIGYGGAGATACQSMLFPTPMRAPPPAVVPTTGTHTNCSVASVLSATASTINIQTTVTALGAMWLDGSFTASADL